ncbi:hypothetical protein [Microbispora sp. CA-102843]|uniref:hypothetical protein n=1 Tax=Microbispora sp. CA-102843 TaxID=3239952 RepID=UPI003D8D8C89
MIRRLTAIAVLIAALAACSGGGAPDKTHSRPSSPTPTPARPSLSAGVWVDTPMGTGVMGSVVATAPDDAWALGGGEFGPLFAHWDGRVWRPARLPEGARSPGVLSGTSADDVWLFDDDMTVWRWDGRRWSRRERPPCPPSAILRTAVATTGGQVWVAGYLDPPDGPSTEFLARWSGASWSSVPSPSGLRFHRLRAAAPDDVWALAWRADDSDAIERWDGHGWRPVPLPASLDGAKVYLYDVAPVSGREAWVAGSYLRQEGSQAALLMRWDGERWTTAAGVPAGTIGFGRVAADGHGGVWLGAQSGHDSNPHILLHFDGRSWMYEKAPRVHDSQSVSAFARIPGGDRMIAVGGNPSYDEDSQAWIWTRR